MIYLTSCRFFQLAVETDYGTSTKNRCRYFFVVFVFFCSQIYQVNNYKRRAL